MSYRNLLLAVLAGCFIVSCQNPSSENGELQELEFALIDSLVFDELEILNILDYDHDKGLYLMVNKGMEGRYCLIDKKGNKIAENKLSEGPDSFGLVLHRGGFVGNEIIFISDQTIFVYDLNLKPLRKYPFKQDPRVKLVHWSLDYLSTFTQNGKVMAIANTSDSFLQPYPADYYDTLNIVHLFDPSNGEIHKGGKLDKSSKLTHGRFYPFMDKPVYFSDANSSYISAIFSGDSILYQLNPKNNFEVVNKIKLDRHSPDNIHDISMSEASFTTVKEHRPKNVTLGGMFANMLGMGDDFILEYKTGADPNLYNENADAEGREAIAKSKKTYYYPIKDGRQIAHPVLWDKPGKLIFSVGKNKYLQYADQADIHEYEKEYQCYYIYELRAKGK